MQDFRDLEVWKNARNYICKTVEIVQKFPRDEKYLLVDQLIRASRSVASNIAEGYGRYHYQENIQFCRIARGSLNETLNHFICALDMGYITEVEFKNIERDFYFILKLLNGYIAYLKQRKINE